MSDWAISDVVRHTGVTSRTLRHYDAIGLLRATSVGTGGIRRYDDEALMRLQRILLLRDLGLSLAQIGEVLAVDGDAVEHLRRHLALLELERDELDKRIEAVRRTIRARENGETMSKDMFDGFDHTQYKDEVTQRWGAAAYRDSSAWWEAKSTDEKRAFQREVAELSAAWVAAAADGEAPDGERAQELAARHVAWLRSVPGTPAANGDRQALAGYVSGLAEMYVADPRFRANYTGENDGVAHGPEFVRDSLRVYVQLNLS